MTTVFKPRNTFVLVRLDLNAEDHVGHITVPTGQDEYTQGEVLAVGPDFPQAEGGLPSTHDLEPGQRVLVKHKRKVQRPSSMGGPPIAALMDEGLPLRPADNEDGDLFLFEQSNILAIVTDTPTGD